MEMTVSRSLGLHSRAEGRQLQMAEAAKEMSWRPAASEREEQNRGLARITGKAPETGEKMCLLKQLGENKELGRD